MLNPGLDIDSLARAFASTGRIRVANVLRPDIAAGLESELAALHYMLFCATADRIAVADPAEAARWDPKQTAELQRALMEAASRSEGYVYHNFRMTEAWKDGAPDTALGRFHRWLLDDGLHDVIRRITGVANFDSAFAQATRYLPGHYLTRHLDDPKGEQRRLAFVWGLTRRWMPDWGGLLQFYTRAGDPTV
jgi:SM-20-related protein